ncbi:MAG TPA: hypothetical protein VGB54_00810 [Allosphingosinicella sp.]|jgi:hypothetical protein
MDSSLTPTIADTMLRARSDVIDHFTGAGATSAGTALTYQPQRHAERRALAFLTSREVVRLTQEGRYWVDDAAADAWRSQNRTRTAWMVGGAVAAVAGLVILRRYRKDRT